MTYRIPTRLIFFILMISTLPIIFNEFTSSNAEGLNTTDTFGATLDFYNFLILEWVGISVAFFSTVFITLYSKVRKDPTITLIAFAIFTSGLMDLFEVLATQKVMFSVSDVNNFLQQSWVVCRSFPALILLSAACISLSNKTPFFLRNNAGLFLTLLFLASIAYNLIGAVTVNEVFPQINLFGENLEQSWNHLVLLFYLCISSTVFYLYDRKKRTVFSHAILLSLIPCIFSQAYMTIASTSPMDSSYNIAHFLKVFTYFVPIIALSHEYLRIYKENDSAQYVVQKAELAKTHFLNNMSHQLRTPLNTVIGFSECMLEGMDGPITDHQSTVLAKISKAGHHLLFLINNILNISKIEANRFEVSPIPTNIVNIVDHCIQDMASFAKEKSLEISLNCEHKEISITIDGPKIQQTIMNVLNNSIKFSERGPIDVSIRKNTGYVEIDIVDHGQGISEAHLNHIFEPFQHQDTAPLSSFQGAGLGLAISKKIIDLHHGKLQVESEKGNGCVFTITLPFTKEDRAFSAEKNEATKKKAGPEKPKKVASTQEQQLREKNNGKVLIIDDDPDSVELITKHLAEANYLSVSTTDSFESMDLIQEHKPDFILLDLLMPKFSGWHVLEKIKEHPEARDIPVAIISLSDKEEEVSKFNGIYFLPKPISQKSLLAFLEKDLKSPV